MVQLLHDLTLLIVLCDGRDELQILILVCLVVELLILKHYLILL